MRILVIAAPFPYPPDTGSRNLIYHWLAAVSKDNEVELMAIDESASGTKIIPELPDLQIKVIPTEIGRRLPSRLVRLSTCAFRGIPATCIIYMPPLALEYLFRKVREEHYDAVVLTENVVAGYATLLAKMVPVVLFKHSVHAVDALDSRKRHGMYHPRWILEEQIVKRYEERTCHAATVVCCVNSEDSADLARRYCLNEPPEIVPIGVELNCFPQRATDPGGKVIGFFGNMRWGANVDAVLWFTEKVLPSIWAQESETRFCVIGPGSKELPFLTHDSRIVAIGQVPPQMIPEALKGITVGLVPVISGTGVRLKLLEMLSMGIPVVSTALGNLGTGCVSGQHILIADEPGAFAQAVISLLRDVEKRKKLALAGPVLAQKHTWEGIYPRIRQVIELGARKKPHSG
jgi:polysaccharide biosynthesis protein PslH